MANRITSIFDLDGRGFDAGLKALRTRIAETDGVFNKLKVAGTGAFETLKANAAAASLAIGAAVVAFSAKSVAASQELALEVGKFSDATKLSSEDSSRWIEVAGDMGIEAGTVQGAIQRMNKALADGSPVADKYGISIKRTADGAVDVNATLLSAIETISNITDPTERAAAAQALFGRSYGEMSELIFNGSEKVRESLDAVSKAKVIDQRELENARRFRDSVDKLQDSLQDVSLTLGSSLTPMLTDVADGIGDVDDAIDDLLPGASGLGKVLGDGLTTAIEGPAGLFKRLAGNADEAGDALEKVSGITELATTRNQDLVQSSIDAAMAQKAQTEATDRYRNQAGEYVQRLKRAGEANEDLAEANKDAAAATAEHRRRSDELRASMERQRSAAIQLVGGELAVRDAQREAEDAAAELNETLATQGLTMRDAGIAIDDATEKQLAAAQAAAEYREQQMQANGQTVNADVQAQLYKEELQKLANQLDGPLKQALLTYIAQLDDLDGRTITTTLVLKGGNGTGSVSIGSGGGNTGGLTPGGNTTPGGRGIERIGGTVGAEYGTGGRPSLMLSFAGANFYGAPDDRTLRLWADAMAKYLKGLL